MNERIRELAEQAGMLKEQTVKAKIVKNEDGTWTSILEYPDLEKFAELIIQECMHMCEVAQWGCITHGWDKQAQGCQSAQEYIAEHFGVEE